MELIISIIFIAYIIKALIESNKNEKRQDDATYKNPWDKVPMGQPMQTTSSSAPKTQGSQQNNSWQQAARENIEKARQRAAQKLHEFEGDVLKELNTTIVDRARKNADANKVDVTLQTMEAEHNHSERVSAAVHKHTDDVILESTLGTVEDLMVKGYDGNLCFERDFVGEGLDMISRFTVPSDVPDFS